MSRSLLEDKLDFLALLEESGEPKPLKRMLARVISNLLVGLFEPKIEMDWVNKTLPDMGRLYRTLERIKQYKNDEPSS